MKSSLASMPVHQKNHHSRPCSQTWRLLNVLGRPTTVSNRMN